ATRARPAANAATSRSCATARVSNAIRAEARRGAAEKKPHQILESSFSFKHLPNERGVSFSSPPGLTRWSMLLISGVSSLDHASMLFVLRISMDCRVKPGNDDPDY